MLSISILSIISVVIQDSKSIVADAYIARRYTMEPAMARAYESIELQIKERMDGYWLEAKDL